MPRILKHLLFYLLSFLSCTLWNTLKAQVNLNAGLVAYYPFNGNANDVSGNNNNPAFNNASLTNDRFGNANAAYRFNGIDNYMQIPNDPTLNFNNTISLVAWVKVDGFYQGTCHGNRIIMKGDADYLIGNYLLTFDDNAFTNGQNCVNPVPDISHENFYGVNSIQAPGYSPYIQTNQWYCVIYTSDGTTAKLFVNCELKSSGPIGSFTFTNSYDLFLGKLNDPTFPYWFNGDIDDVRIYDRALNTDEINAIGGCNTTTSCNNWLSTPSYPSYVTAGDIDIAGDKITVEALFNRESAFFDPQLYGKIVSKHSDESNVNYALMLTAAEITTVNNGYVVVFPPCDPTFDKTYHVAMVYDGSSLKYYRNGFLMASAPASGNLVTNDLLTTFGNRAIPYPPGQSVGYSNEIRIWNVARTQAQIKANMNNSLPNPTTQPGLVAYYTFDNLLNKQGNTAFNGTLNGGATINATNPNCTFIPDSCLATPCASKEDFTIQLNACASNFISLQTTATATSYISIKWDMGDGIILSNTPNPTHSYANGGTYDIVMIIEKTGCNDTIKKRVTLGLLPENIINTNDTIICLGASKKIIGLPYDKFCWSPITYLDNPNSNTPTASPTNTTKYYYTAERLGSNIVFNGDFSAGNSGFSSDYSYVSNNTTEGEYFVGNDPIGWNNLSGACTDHTTGNGNMMMINGSPTPNAIVWSQTVNVLPNTNYSFSLWIQSISPFNPALLRFSINGIQMGADFSGESSVCNWKKHLINWNSGNNTTILISIVNKNTTVLGNDFTLDDISFAPIFIVRDSVTIAIDTPSIKTNDNTLICVNKSVQLNTIGATNYSWSPSTGLSNPNMANPVASPATTTSYIVTGTNANGCVAKDTVTIALKPTANFTINPAIAACTNNLVKLNADGGDTYLWSPASLLNNASVKNPVANISSNTTFTVTITDTVCQVSKDLTTDVSILLSPNVQITEPPDINCNNPAAQLIASGAQRYNWFPAVGLSNSTIGNPIVSIDTSTTYIVKGTDNNGCFAYDTVTLKVTRNGKLAFDMPNAFTPNKDGHNDCFGLGRFAGLVQSLQLSVYNRWGQRVFYTTNPNACWDGTLKGNLQDSGGYIYLLKVKTFCGNFDKKGIVMLLR